MSLTGYFHVSATEDPKQTAHGHYIEQLRFDRRFRSLPITHDHKNGHRAHDHEGPTMCEMTPAGVLGAQEE